MDSPLCDDMVKIEILSRTSLKTLHAMRCLSKEFEKLTYEPYLLDLHKQRNDNMVSGFLLENRIGCSDQYTYEFAASRGSKNIDLGFLPFDAQVLASSEQGIIVFQSPNPKTSGLISYHVCKPATKQILAIPNPRTKYLTEKVAIVVVGSNPMHYKIVRLSSCRALKRGGEFYTTYRCEVFNSRTWAWKLLDLLMLPYLVNVDKQQLPITTRGSIYMLSTNPYNILKFDAYSEKWTTFSSPVSTHDESYTTRHLVKHEGRLGFACKSTNGCEVWVLGSDELWEKIYVINVKDEGIYHARKLSFDDPNRSVMISYPDTMLFYNGKNVVNTVTNVRSKMFVYRSDFEPANLRGRLE